MEIKTGMGYDLHRLHKRGIFILGNVQIPYNKGFLAHSDGDVLIHAVIDALLGAANMGDIGTLFPDTSSRYKGIDSSVLLSDVTGKILEAGYKIANIDTTIVCQEPKLGPHISSIKTRLAEIMKISEIGRASCRERV